MKRALLRFVALLLVPCLMTDPVIAQSFDSAVTEPQSIHRSLFNQSAFAMVPLWIHNAHIGPAFSARAAAATLAVSSLSPTKETLYKLGGILLFGVVAWKGLKTLAVRATCRTVEKLGPQISVATQDLSEFERDLAVNRVASLVYKRTRLERLLGMAAAGLSGAVLSELALFFWYHTTINWLNCVLDLGMGGAVYAYVRAFGISRATNEFLHDHVIPAHPSKLVDGNALLELRAYIREHGGENIVGIVLMPASPNQLIPENHHEYLVLKVEAEAVDGPTEADLDFHSTLLDQFPSMMGIATPLILSGERNGRKLEFDRTITYYFTTGLSGKFQVVAGNAEEEKYYTMLIEHKIQEVVNWTPPAAASVGGFGGSGRTAVVGGFEPASFEARSANHLAYPDSEMPPILRRLRQSIDRGEKNPTWGHSDTESDKPFLYEAVIVGAGPSGKRFLEGLDMIPLTAEQFVGGNSSDSRQVLTAAAEKIKRDYPEIRRNTMWRAIYNIADDFFQITPVATLPYPGAHLLGAWLARRLLKRVRGNYRKAAWLLGTCLTPQDPVLRTLDQFAAWIDRQNAGQRVPNLHAEDLPDHHLLRQTVFDATRHIIELPRRPRGEEIESSAHNDASDPARRLADQIIEHFFPFNIVITDIQIPENFLRPFAATPEANGTAILPRHLAKAA